eukprot:TRINITY_DN11860_c0_g1_i1.p1 TRINITY_DN11860_c0_g1~~TRINITY_DN11860_c0_g1_i1.p1  ORF type:complete len:603 (+),score=105.82 TRINITY_DN11860_c0_g1_i1:26-1834(+)
MKILVAGDVSGQFDKLFRRVSEVNSKSGPYDCLLCVGSFFHATNPNGAANNTSLAYLCGTQPIDVPTYFIDTGFKGVLPDEGGELCTNLTFLGKSGLKIIHGLQVAYVCGKFNEEVITDPTAVSSTSAYTLASVRDLVKLKGKKKIDILLTAEWPANVTEKSPSATHAVTGSQTMAELAKEIGARYHFAGTANIFFRREPFTALENTHVTRFFGLAGVGSKEKWLYAMNMVPATKMDPKELQTVPADATENPFLNDVEMRLFRKEKLDREEQERKREPAVDFTQETKELLELLRQQQRIQDEMWFGHIISEQDKRQLGAIVQDGKNVRVSVYLTANALDTRISSWHERGGLVNVEVNVPPGPQALRTLRALLALVVGVPPCDVLVNDGSRPREKEVYIHQVDAETVRRRVKAVINVVLTDPSDLDRPVRQATEEEEDSSSSESDEDEPRKKRAKISAQDIINQDILSSTPVGFAAQQPAVTTSGPRIMQPQPLPEMQAVPIDGEEALDSDIATKAAQLATAKRLVRAGSPDGTDAPEIGLLAPKLRRLVRPSATEPVQTQYDEQTAQKFGRCGAQAMAERFFQQDTQRAREVLKKFYQRNAK